MEIFLLEWQTLDGTTCPALSFLSEYVTVTPCFWSLFFEESFIDKVVTLV